VPDEVVERTVRIVPGPVLDTVEIDPALDSFQQYQDACAAVYGSIYGARVYKELPQPLPRDFELSLFIGATELRVHRKTEAQLNKAGLQVARILRKKHKLPAVFKPSTAEA
jgi:hypothetical protein